MKLLITLVLTTCFFTSFTHAQKLLKVVYVNDGKITRNPKEADWLIAIKSVKDGFERSDYKMNGPLKRVKTFKDSTQKILHGKYQEYNNNGNLILVGHYTNNEKSGTWIYFDDSLKIIKKDLFASEPSAIVHDSVNNTIPGQRSELQPPSFKGGKSAMHHFIFDNLDTEIKPNPLKDEKVIVGFTVTANGSVKNIFICKSEYFALDQETLRIFSKMPRWKPATYNGIPVDYNKAEGIVIYHL